ncbi:MAG: hypothetical protein KDA84_05475, partial [Planctomycetaceae bacterium]|nr:hypothetical protein [Planctomycetaceae bacterium]
MIARLSVSVVLAACVMWPALVSAQSGSDSEGVFTIGDGIPEPIVPQITSQWKTPTSVPKADAKSEFESIIRGQSPGGPIQFAGAYAPQSGVDSYGDGGGFQAQPLPWERGYNSPLRKFIKEVLPNNYFRVEYLSWFIDDLGSQAVGAPTVIQPDPREPIQSAEFFRDSSQASNPGNSQTLIIPTTESINFERVSGLRGTYGIPLTFGRLEFSAFALEESGGDILDPSFGPIRGTRVVTAPFELQTGQFVLAQDFIVPVNPISGQQGFDATTSGTVQVRAIPVGAGVGLQNNIPAGSTLPPSATPLPPGNPPLINFRPQILGSNLNPIITPVGQRFNLPTGLFYGQFPVSGLTGVTQQVTFDSSVPNLVALLNAGIINGNPPVPPPALGTNPPTGVGIFFIRSGTSQTPVAGN